MSEKITEKEVGPVKGSIKKNSLKKILTILILVIFCVIATGYFQNINYGQVYTHLFYVPIILACVWWQRKGVLVALFLGAVLMVFHVIFRHEVSLLNDLLRSLLFFIVAVFVSEISRSEKVKSFLLKKETARVEKYLNKIDEKDLKLDTSFLGLAFKNHNIEKLQERIISKDKKINELKIQISKLKG